MKSIRALLAVLIIAALSGSVSFAQEGAIWVESIVSPNTEEVSVFMVPDGSGSPLTQATLFGGQVTDASLTVRVVDDLGFPLPNYPREDIYLDSETHTEFVCTTIFMPEANTNANGELFFTGGLRGGGSNEGPIWVYQHGWRAHASFDLEQPSIPMRLNSADINADGLVNLSDVAEFAADYYGLYNYRSDFQWDGVVDLSDVVKMAGAMGKDCPQ